MEIEKMIDNLSIGIIHRACLDYVTAGVILAKCDPDSKEYKRADKMMDDCFTFFKSQWFTFLSPDLSMTGEKLMDRLNDKIEEQLKGIEKGKDYRILLNR